MKKLLQIIAVIFPLSAFSQMPIDTVSNNYQYREVVTSNGSKAEIYSKARLWFVKMYKDAGEVLQVQDSEGGLLVGKGFFLVQFQGAQRKVYHTVTVECKEDRFRVTVTDFALKFSQSYNEKPFELLTSKYFWGLDKLYHATNLKTTDLISSLKLSTQQKNEEW